MEKSITIELVGICFSIYLGMTIIIIAPKTRKRHVIVNPFVTVKGTVESDLLDNSAGPASYFESFPDAFAASADETTKLRCAQQVRRKNNVRHPAQYLVQLVSYGSMVINLENPIPFDNGDMIIRFVAMMQ